MFLSFSSFSLCFSSSSSSPVHPPSFVLQWNHGLQSMTKTNDLYYLDKKITLCYNPMGITKMKNIANDHTKPHMTDHQITTKLLGIWDKKWFCLLSAPKGFTFCCGLNACIPPNSYVEVLPSICFIRSLVIWLNEVKGWNPHDGIRSLIKRRELRVSSLHHVRLE